MTRSLVHLCLLAVLGAAPALAQSAAAPAPIPAPAAAADPLATGSVWGRILDARSGEPLSAVRVRLREVGRTELSHPDGAFHFDRLTPGRYRVIAERIGYAPAQLDVDALARDTVHVTIRMMPSAVEVAGIVVTGMGRERSSGEAYRPTTVVDGAELRRRLGSSVAATLAEEPGIAQRYNGPAAAQPIVRGLGGDRVLVLEDGNRTGDIAASAADHAVAIDPLTAERVEVLRGPAGVLYGSSALGGVINVIREEVPRTLPEQLTGTVSAQLESVNRGAAAGGSLLGAVGDVALRAELSGRAAGDTRTPLGMLPSSELEGHNAALGASWIADRGFAGAALRDYGLEYGVPGTFEGRTIPGAHEGGVSIAMRRTALRTQTAYFPAHGPLRSIELDGNFTRFLQDETEASGEIGSSFDQLTGSLNLLARHEHRRPGVRLEGAFGVWAHARDFLAFGSRTGTRPARQFNAAGFAYEEFGLHALRLQVGVRYDWTRIVPRDTRAGMLGEVRTRDFGALSGSFAAVYELMPGISVGASLARAFRTPTIEELFSDGPHLADYSFNIGNPQLGAEYGLGADAFVRVSRPGVHAEASVYSNRLDGYIHYRPTGQLDPRFGQYPVYQATAADAVLRGFEAKAQWEVVRHLVLLGSASHVVGHRRPDGEPLPTMPPAMAGLGVRYDGPLFLAHVGWRAAAAKRAGELAENETPTPGSQLWNAGAGLRWTAWGRLHTLTLEAQNLTDVAWYDHLSRIKSVAPQPGRNLQLLYRVNF